MIYLGSGLRAPHQKIKGVENNQLQDIFKNNGAFLREVGSQQLNGQQSCLRTLKFVSNKS